MKKKIAAKTKPTAPKKLSSKTSGKAKANSTPASRTGALKKESAKRGSKPASISTPARSTRTPTRVVSKPDFVALSAAAERGKRKAEAAAKKIAAAESAIVAEKVEAILEELAAPCVEVAPKNVVKCLPCEDCGRPIAPGELAVVIEYGPKPAGAPDFLGKPWKRVRCTACNDKAVGRTPRVSKEKADAHARRPDVTAAATEHKLFKKQKPEVKESAGKLIGKIYRLVKDNPRKEGTHGHRSFALIKDGMTVEAYLTAGGRNNDLRWDIDHKFVELR